MEKLNNGDILTKLFETQTFHLLVAIWSSSVRLSALIKKLGS